MSIVEMQHAASSSFQATCDACRLASRTGELVRFHSLGKSILAAPGDNPHALYKQWFPEMHSKETLDHFYATRVPA